MGACRSGCVHAYGKQSFDSSLIDLTGKCFSFGLVDLSRLFIQIGSSLLLTDLSFIENHEAQHSLHTLPSKSFTGL